MSTAARALYEDIAADYARPTDPYLVKYHTKRFRVAAALLKGLRGTLFDFGAGHGELAEYVSGFRIEACDLSPAMVALSRQRYRDIPTEVGGLDYFLRLQGPYDVVVALNVLPYLTSDEEAQFFAHARRIAGHVLVSHTNMLFDLVSMNRYTVDFYREQFSGCVPAEAMAHLPDLLAHAHLPPRSDVNASERDLLPKRRVDPFTYRPAAFDVVETRFLNFFPLPPVLLQSRKEWEVLQPDIELSGTLAALFSTQFQMLLRPSGEP